MGRTQPPRAGVSRSDDRLTAGDDVNTLPRQGDRQSDAGSAPASDGDVPRAVRAFDAVAPQFDERYGQWASVRAQRRAVQREFASAFQPGSALLELGGGTGDDALFLAGRGHRILLTDGSPAMLASALRKITAAGFEDRIKLLALPLERVSELRHRFPESLPPPYDGAYSNFAALNCLQDLRPFAASLAPFLRPGAPVLLVMFGPCSVGEIIVQLLHANGRAAFRRFSNGAVAASIAGHAFTVRYPSPRIVARELAPHFRLIRTSGIGVFVPPSAAEPAISRYPRLLRLLERLDAALSGPLAWMADHVLLHFRRV
ncbi:MAG TPA: class I SAM-dependent methyltransferase [Gemmatimonadaceae bacterium]|nr:class I SAM-dependent methyltransferase [Gemmatimonadaceae bacterium]